MATDLLDDHLLLPSEDVDARAERAERGVVHRPHEVLEREPGLVGPRKQRPTLGEPGYVLARDVVDRDEPTGARLALHRERRPRAVPVPASPSGGHRGIPAGSLPDGSRRFAPSAVSLPASRPAGMTSGRMSRSLQGSFRRSTSASNVAIRAASQSLVSRSIGNIPDASPTPMLCSPVSFQCT